MTSVLHRFPYLVINFFAYENTLDVLTGMRQDRKESTVTAGLLARRVSARLLHQGGGDDNDHQNDTLRIHEYDHDNSEGTSGTKPHQYYQQQHASKRCETLVYCRRRRRQMTIHSCLTNSWRVRWLVW
jgi:hypothetical protein